MIELDELLIDFEPVGTSQWTALDQCHNESVRFLLLLREAGIEAELISGFRFEEHFGQSVIVAGHTAVRVGDLVYDWTARQFEPDAPLPKVTTVADFHEEWEKI